MRSCRRSFVATLNTINLYTIIPRHYQVHVAQVIILAFKIRLIYIQCYYATQRKAAQ
jgi:hypothetical protein